MDRKIQTENKETEAGNSDTQAGNPSYSGGRTQEDPSPGPVAGRGGVCLSSQQGGKHKQEEPIRNNKTLLEK
jgi:hypothetical protein